MQFLYRIKNIINKYINLYLNAKYMILNIFYKNPFIVIQNEVFFSTYVIKYRELYYMLEFQMGEKQYQWILQSGKTTLTVFYKMHSKYKLYHNSLTFSLFPDEVYTIDHILKPNKYNLVQSINNINKLLILS